MVRAIPVTGTLAAQEQSVLSAKVSGRLQRLEVDLGSVVRQGDLLAQVEPRDYELRLQQAAAALAQARTALGLPLEGDDDQVEVEQASTVKQAAAVLDEAAKNLQRVRNLSRAGIASPSELDAVEAAHTLARARHDTAVEEARTRLATLAQRRAEFEIARKQLADASVRAPFDGAVQARLASVGEFVGSGVPILRLVKTDPLRLRLEVPERESIHVRLGQSVRVLVEGDTNAYAGRLARLSPALSELSRIMLVEADVPREGSLRPGLFARAQIVIRERDEALGVPAAALTTFAGLEKVVLLRDGRALEKVITTGRHEGNWVEVLAGLKAGETVVLDPAGLRTGQRVIILDAPSNQTSRETSQTTARN
jgi:RND family efflux transporter MFP subunit